MFGPTWPFPDFRTRPYYGYLDAESEFEIKNAKDSSDHVENFARENLNLTYPDEEFIIFDDNDEKLDERR